MTEDGKRLKFMKARDGSCIDFAKQCVNVYRAAVLKGKRKYRAGYVYRKAYAGSYLYHKRYFFITRGIWDDYE